MPVNGVVVALGEVRVALGLIAVRPSCRIEADDVKAMLPLARDAVLVQFTQPVDLSGNRDQQPLEVVGRQLVKRQQLRPRIHQNRLRPGWRGQQRIIIREGRRLLRRGSGVLLHPPW